MVLTVVAAVVQVELGIRRERTVDSTAGRRTAGKDLGGRRQVLTAPRIHGALRRIEAGSEHQVDRDLGMSRATLYRSVREPPTPVARGGVPPGSRQPSEGATRV